MYIENVSSSLHKECGEKPYKNDLDKPSMLQDLYQTEDSLLLNQSI
jgi:hypothetical protein